MKPKTYIRSGLIYMVVSYVGTFLSIFSSFILRLFVPTTVFGAISIVTGIQNYFEMFNVIFRNAIDREVPFLIARKRERSARLLIDVSFSVISLLLLVQTIILVCFGLIADTLLLKVAWFSMAVSLPFLSLSTAYKILLKSQQNFADHNRAYLLGSVIGNILLVVLGIFIEEWGYFIGYALSAFIQYVIFKRKYSFTFVFPFFERLQRTVFKRIIYSGSTIAMLSLSYQVVISIDRFFIAGNYGLEELGAYSLASLIMMKVFDLPKMVVGVYMPKLMSNIATKEIQTIKRNNTDLKLALISVSVVVASAVHLCIGKIVELALPAYLDYVIYIKVLLIGSVIWTFKSICQQVNVAFKNVGPVLFFNIGILIFLLLYYYVISQLKMPLIYFSIGMVGSIVLSALVVYFYELKLLDASVKGDYKAFFLMFLFTVGSVSSILMDNIYVSGLLFLGVIMMSLNYLYKFYSRIKAS